VKNSVVLGAMLVSLSSRYNLSKVAAASGSTSPNSYTGTPRTKTGVPRKGWVQPGVVRKSTITRNRQQCVCLVNPHKGGGAVEKSLENSFV